MMKSINRACNVEKINVMSYQKLDLFQKVAEMNYQTASVQVHFQRVY